ncbi:MAG: hypothetical protein MH137_13840 [Flavobacteriales bacterium]|nr:hypothetical protein [Flavobacteriales bacterium]
MKKVSGILLLLFVSLSAKSQDIYTPFRITEYPVEFKHLNDYSVNRVGEMSYIITNNITEFYLKGFNLSNKFNADSLQRMFEKDLYNDENIVNLQMREKGRGSLGGLDADRLVMEFVDDSRAYKVIAFMVYFHINHEYNALLFFFDMERKSSESYEQVLVNMGQTLKWDENIPYKPYTDPETGISTELPVFWRTQPQNDAKSNGFLIDDGRARFTYEIKPSADSTAAGLAAKAELTKLKTNPGMYLNYKFKASTPKLPSKEVYGVLTGTYRENVNGLLRPTLFKRVYFKRVVNGVLSDITITLEAPQVAVTFYAPIHQRMYDKIVIPGSPYIAPKKKKK